MHQQAFVFHFHDLQMQGCKKEAALKTCVFHRKSEKITLYQYLMML